jgi:tetratricopeptide (TPR) repeat protein
MSGFRFFRRKKLMLGLTLNLSRSVPSLRIGGRGAGVTLGGRSRVRTTVGIPGTGLYYSKTASGGRRVRRRSAPLRSTYSTTQTPTNYKGCLYALGILTLVVATIASYGLVLIPAAIGVGAWVWYRYKQPESISQRIIKRAQLAEPAEAVGLFNQALNVDPHGLKTLRAAASWFSQHQCYQDAAESYAGIVHLQDDLRAERMYVACLLSAGRVDEAIPRLEHIRALSTPGDSLESEVLSELASAYLLKGETSQAMAFIDLAPLKKRNLDAPLQMCLYLRGVGRYVAGDRRRAIADLERLYAANPSFPDLNATKAAMEDGKYVFAPAKPYPDWYPIDHRDAVLPSESEIPADEYPLAGSTQEATAKSIVVDSALVSPSTPIAPIISPDGAWRWDGTRWTPNTQ